MAKAQPNEESNNSLFQKHAESFHKEYAVATERAMSAADTTNTPAYQDIYHQFFEQSEKYRQDVAGHLTDIASLLKLRLLSEEEEKILSEAKKTSQELNQTFAAFDKHTVDPIRAAALECHTVIQRHLADAAEAVRLAPLHTRGLIEYMENEISLVPQVQWNAKTGRVIIKNNATNTGNNSADA